MPARPIQYRSEPIAVTITVLANPALLVRPDTPAVPIPVAKVAIGAVINPEIVAEALQQAIGLTDQNAETMDLGLVNLVVTQLLVVTVTVIVKYAVFQQARPATAPNRMVLHVPVFREWEQEHVKILVQAVQALIILVKADFVVRHQAVQTILPKHLAIKGHVRELALRQEHASPQI